MWPRFFWWLVYRYWRRENEGINLLFMARAHLVLEYGLLKANISFQGFLVHEIKCPPKLMLNVFWILLWPVCSLSRANPSYCLECFVHLPVLPLIWIIFHHTFVPSSNVNSRKSGIKDYCFYLLYLPPNTDLV